ncbi:unnamed protein product [Peniophora sp. CBMAI 1063]|nr:unnamed protein product [Peniophora sp. CBMAI 1063]
MDCELAQAAPPCAVELARPPQIWPPRSSKRHPRPLDPVRCDPSVCVAVTDTRGLSSPGARKFGHRGPQGNKTPAQFALWFSLKLHAFPVHAFKVNILVYLSSGHLGHQRFKTPGPIVLHVHLKITRHSTPLYFFVSLLIRTRLLDPSWLLPSYSLVLFHDCFPIVM